MAYKLLNSPRMSGLSVRLYRKLW